MLDAGCLLGYNPVCFLGYNAGCFLGYNAGSWMLTLYNGRRGFHSGASVNSVYVFSSFPFSTSSREARPGPGVHKPEGLAIRMASAWGDFELGGGYYPVESPPAPGGSPAPGPPGPPAPGPGVNIALM